MRHPLPGLRAALLVAALILTGFAAARPAAGLAAPGRQETLTWRDTGVNLRGYEDWCFGDRANRLLATDGASKVSIDWSTGQIIPLEAGSTMACWQTPEFDSGPATRLTNLPSPEDPDQKSRLLVSTDGGAGWQERGQQFEGRIGDVDHSLLDRRAIYALVYDQDAGYAVYFSPDTGTTWERRYARPGSGGDLRTRIVWPVELTVLGTPGRVEILQLVEAGGGMGSTRRWDYSVSLDRGRSFIPAGRRAAGSDVSLGATTGGVIRILSDQGRAEAPYSLAFLSFAEPAKGWQTLNTPWPADKLFSPQPGAVPLWTLPYAPANVFVKVQRTGRADIDAVYYSPDEGRSWQSLTGPGQDIHFAPYAPLSVLIVDWSQEGRLYSLDLPRAGKSLTRPLPDYGAAGAAFFSQTGHYLAAPFRQYWEAHGGLAQFGYPRTEAFPEASPTDGRVYLTQYFERNRFEYHPEHKGTPHEVQLGLLGSQLTKERRAAREGAFNPIADPREPGRLYFAQTGHTLRNSFRHYWESRGGLALYGYPISEEFHEQNGGDGKTYVVQYFERNRFEWHPENKGTPYEVLLGTLGNELLKLKGW